MMKAIKQLPLVAFLLTAPYSTQAQAGDVLTGDTRLACEAVLCLSSSTRPSECNPALSRYFGIQFKNPVDTIKARINFLNLCPAAHEPNMPSLITAIANGAGKCDAKFLNTYNKAKAYKTTCTKPGIGHWNEDNTSCSTSEVSIVSDQKPSYCKVYENHDYTNLHVTYVGNKYTGGFWAEAKDYDMALGRYNDAYQGVPDGVTYSDTPNKEERWYERDSR